MTGPLTAQWEARLTAEGLGLVDDAREAHGRERQADEQSALVPRLRAEFWRRAELCAADLPYAWPRGRFVRLAASLGNVNRAARECGLTQKAGEWAWRRFLVFAGLPAPLVKGSQGRKRPTKPGQRRVEAGRYREERAA